MYYLTNIKKIMSKYFNLFYVIRLTKIVRVGTVLIILKINVNNIVKNNFNIDLLEIK